MSENDTFDAIDELVKLVYLDNKMICKFGIYFLDKLRYWSGVNSGSKYDDLMEAMSNLGLYQEDIALNALNFDNVEEFEENKRRLMKKCDDAANLLFQKMCD